MFSHLKRYLFLVVTSHLLVGCAMDFGERVDPEAFKKLVVGVTTVDTAISLVGRPSGTFKDQEGNLVLFYAATKTHFIGAEYTPAKYAPVQAKTRQEHAVTSLFFDLNGKYLRSEGAP